MKSAIVRNVLKSFLVMGTFREFFRYRKKSFFRLEPERRIFAIFSSIYFCRIKITIDIKIWFSGRWSIRIIWWYLKKFISDRDFFGSLHDSSIGSSRLLFLRVWATLALGIFGQLFGLRLALWFLELPRDPSATIHVPFGRNGGSRLDLLRQNAQNLAPRLLV